MALTADRNLVEKVGTLQALEKGAVKIYKNALLMIDTDGLAKPCTPKAATNFAGIAYTGAEAADKKIKTEQKGTWYLKGTGFTQADVGKKVYAVDDETVTVTQGTNSKQVVGVIVEYVSATEVGVMIMPYSGVGAAS